LKLECSLCNKLVEVTDEHRMGREDMAAHILEEHENEAFEIVVSGADDFFMEPDGNVEDEVE